MTMKKSTLITAISTIVGLIASIIIVFFFAWKTGVSAMLFCIVGILLSFVLAPTLHEWGHILLGKTQKMRLVYTKFFCFKIAETNGKLRFSFASPFIDEQTQMIPSCGLNMKKRAIKYTAGGLIFGVVSFVLF